MDDHRTLAGTELHAEIERRLKHRGQRYTGVRRNLVSVLDDAGGPLRLPDIVDRAPDLAQSSVYRNLDLLEDCGVVQRVTTTSDHAHFELAEPLIGHHHHLICVRCGKVTDVRLDDELEDLVATHLNAAAKAGGFTALHHSLDVHGICPDCPVDTDEADPNE